MILAFAGRNGCGKETAGKEMSEKLGACERHTYSDILEQTYWLWGYRENSRGDLQMLSSFMREQKGQDALAQAMYAKCKAASSRWVVIDGWRRSADLDPLIAELGLENIVPVWIEANADVRFGRLRIRGQKAGETSMTREVFDLQESAESERQLDAVRDFCRFKIENNGTLEEFMEKLGILYHDLLVAPC